MAWAGWARMASRTQSHSSSGALADRSGGGLSTMNPFPSAVSRSASAFRRSRPASSSAPDRVFARTIPTTRSR